MTALIVRESRKYLLILNGEQINRGVVVINWLKDTKISGCITSYGFLIEHTIINENLDDMPLKSFQDC